MTAQSLFRDPLPGALDGPYISQFLWLPAPFGAEYIDRRIQTQLPGSDHLTRYSDWLDTQNGFGSVFSRPDPVRRHVRNGRDLAEWVHIDVLFQAYFTACLILGSPTNVFDAETDGGIGAPFNPGNPYFAVRNQTGFTCWGGPHIKSLLCEVATRALKATWHQKWQVHRRLRPEELGGVVHHQVTSNRYPGALHSDILASKAVGRVLSANGTGLLPIAFPEGSPTHPSYTAGHATVAGACVTILKWFYDERFVISQPVVPTPDGLALQPYQGPPLTVGGELNKLASNIASGRNIAGVHWRSDARESLRLGEELAISILRDQRQLFPETYSGSTFTRFDGPRSLFEEARTMNRTFVSAVVGLSLNAAALPVSAQPLSGVTFHNFATAENGVTYQREPSTTKALAVALQQRGSASLSSLLFGYPVKSNGAPGVALLDFNGDGDLDIYVTNGPGKDNALYRNRLAEDGRFSLELVPDAAGAAATEQDSTGACFGDIDNDGAPDLLVLGRKQPKHLYENQGELRRHQQPAGQRHRPGLRPRSGVLCHGRRQRRRPARYFRDQHVRLEVQGGDPRRALGPQRVQPALHQHG